MSWFGKIRAAAQVELVSEDSRFFVHRSVRLDLARRSRVVVNRGQVLLGYMLPGQRAVASMTNAAFVVEEGAVVEFDGDVVIAPGLTIHVLKGAHLRFCGENHIAQNLLLRCTKSVTLERGASLSWNVSMMDWDGHDIQHVDSGRLIRPPYRSLVIGPNVGIQMNVVIPRGVTIGANAVVAAGTVLRRDVPADSFVYGSSELHINRAFARPRVALPRSAPLLPESGGLVAAQIQ